jgi:hypothetical protein
MKQKYNEFLEEYEEKKPHIINYSNLSRKMGSDYATIFTQTIFKNGELYFYTNNGLFLTNCKTITELKSLQPFPIKKGIDINLIRGWNDKRREKIIEMLNWGLSGECIIFPKDEYFWNSLKVFNKKSILEISSKKITAYENDNMNFDFINNKIKDSIRFNLSWIREIEPKSLFLTKEKLPDGGSFWISEDKTFGISSLFKRDENE